jgi:hypothetical protein
MIRPRTKLGEKIILFSTLFSSMNCEGSVQISTYIIITRDVTVLFLSRRVIYSWLATPDVMIIPPPSTTFQSLVT